MLKISNFSSDTLVCGITCTDFYCRFQKNNAEELDTFLAGDIKLFSVIDWVYKPDNHYCEMQFEIVKDKVFVTCIESCDGKQIVHQRFKLTSAQLYKLYNL